MAVTVAATSPPGAGALGEDVAAGTNGILRAALLVFLLVCVFDPADLLLGLKAPLFLVCWFIVVVQALGARGTTNIHRGLLTYVLLFIAVPAASILWYVFWSGGEPYAGFQLLKGYVLITLALILFARRINLVPLLSAVLVLLAVAVIGTSVVLSARPELFTPLYLFGTATGIFILDNRDYGGGLVLQQVYFVTSPMLAIAIAHYFNAARTTRGAARWWFSSLVTICVAAMFLAGTRNNMAVAILLPATLLVIGSRRFVETALVSATLLLSIAIVFNEQVLQLLDPSEASNSLKLMLIQDYERLLQEPLTMFVGRGLGAYDYWNTRAAYFYVSELTYLELVRNFGIFGAATMLGLLLYPVLYAFALRPSYPDRHIVAGYAFYLVMCASNPNLFSSMGITILAVIVANILSFERRRTQTALRESRA
jgi:hypothetical protein